MEKDTAKLTTSAICFMRLFVYIIFSPFFFITDIHTQSIVCQILCLYCLAKNTNWKATKSAPQSLAKKPNSAETRQKMVNVLVCCIFFLGIQRKNNKTQRNIDRYGCLRLADILWSMKNQKYFKMYSYLYFCSGFKRRKILIDPKIHKQDFLFLPIFILYLLSSSTARFGKPFVCSL